MCLISRGASHCLKLIDPANCFIRQRHFCIRKPGALPCHRNLVLVPGPAYFLQFTCALAIGCLRQFPFRHVAHLLGNLNSRQSRSLVLLLKAVISKAIPKPCSEEAGLFFQSADRLQLRRHMNPCLYLVCYLMPSP